MAFGGSEVFRILRELDVGGEVGLGGAAVFVGHRPLTVPQVCNRRHPGPRIRIVNGDVIDRLRPVDAVGAGLVVEFLAVLWVALVGIVDDQLAVCLDQDRLPDRRLAVVGDRPAAGSNVADERPGLALIAARVKVELGLRQVVRD